MYKDYNPGGAVITERLYIDVKQDFLKKSLHFRFYVIIGQTLKNLTHGAGAFFVSNDIVVGIEK